MTSNLGYEVKIAGATYKGANNLTGEEISFVAHSCASNNACALDGNTLYNSTYGTWYYSWYAATAESANSLETNNADAPYSICPAKWRLSQNYTANQDKSYGSIAQEYLGEVTDGVVPDGQYCQILNAFPLNFKISGSYWSSVFRDTGGANYWTSTVRRVNNGVSAYQMGYGLGSDNRYFVFFSEASNGKYLGNNVRCVSV